MSADKTKTAKTKVKRDMSSSRQRNFNIYFQDRLLQASDLTFSTSQTKECHLVRV